MEHADTPQEVIELIDDGFTFIELSKEGMKSVRKLFNDNQTLVEAARAMLNTWDDYEMLAALDTDIQNNLAAALEPFELDAK